MNKEQVYDESISPLMTQIIEICREHKIAMLADFSIPTDDDPFLRCLTSLLVSEYDPPQQMLDALSVIEPATPPPLMITTTKADGSKVITAVLG